MISIVKKIVLSTVVALFICSIAPINSHAISVKNGDIAPEFSLIDLDGNSVKLSDFKGKKNVLVTFWATWCAKCWEEILFIQSSLSHYDDLQILLINMEKRGISEAHVNKIKNVIHERKIKYPVLLDTKLSAYKDYGISSLPSTAIINKEGIVKFAGPHFYKEYKDKINAVLKAISTK